MYYIDMLDFAGQTLGSLGPYEDAPHVISDLTGAMCVRVVARVNGSMFCAVAQLAELGGVRGWLAACGPHREVSVYPAMCVRFAAT